MIFLTLGSQKFQFNRLLSYVDDLINQGIVSEEVFAQTGYSDYVPKYFRHSSFLSRDSFVNNLDQATTVITHAGTGAIVTAIKSEKKVIAVPRLSKYGEHVDDHQVELVSAFRKQGLILCANNKEELITSYQNLSKTELNFFSSNNEEYINFISNYIRS